MMKSEPIREAVSLSEKLGHVFVTTADTEGLPHVAAAGGLKWIADGRVEVSAWFCPGTVSNLQYSRKTSLVVWDPTLDIGYQLLGEVEKVEEKAFMDGYAPEVRNPKPLPQVERRLLVRVDRVLAFSHAPHTDAQP